ncbi:MAG: DUF1444 family protein [Chloroflexi bacterium]|nr:DUF1444 family protein [Ardenticatenaceae bacterium]NOG36770.1 DUF1444 family protein [Chloroflexota bacterium]
MMLKLNAFTKHIKTATQEAGFTVTNQEGTVLHIVLHTQTMRCDLAPLYRAYQNAPERLDDIVQSHLAALHQALSAATPLTEKEAAESLLPLLQQRQWLQQAGAKVTAPLATRPFTTNILISYVFDHTHHRVYINVEMISRMTQAPGASFDAIHEYALQNLRRRTTAKTAKTHGIGDKTMVFCETDDGFAATRILLPELLEAWHGRVPGKMLLGIPNRDLLLAFSDRHPAKTAVMRQIRRDCQRHKHPLLSSPLVWEKGLVKEYEPVH